MRKILFTVLLLFFLVVSFFFVKNFFVDDKSFVSPTPSAVLGESENAKKLEFSFKGEEYVLYWFSVKNGDNVTLIPNFFDKLSSSVAYEQYNCKFLTNGGFYTPESSPTGLFISNGKELYPFRENILLNGIVSVNDMGVARITRNYLEGTLVNAVQTGPLVVENGSRVAYELSADKSARRVVAFTTGDNSLGFMVVFLKKSRFMGPYLSDMYEVLSIFSRETGVEIADAVNLDGGSASSFYSPNLSVSELVSVGSFFCVK